MEQVDAASGNELIVEPKLNQSGLFKIGNEEILIVFRGGGVHVTVGVTGIYVQLKQLVVLLGKFIGHHFDVQVFIELKHTLERTAPAEFFHQNSGGLALGAADAVRAVNVVSGATEAIEF